MKWKILNDDFENNNFETMCPACKQKLLEAKLEKINLINEYQKTQADILLLEEIRIELEKIKKEKANEFYFFLCKKHKIININNN